MNSLSRILPLLALDFFTAASSRGTKPAIPQTPRLSRPRCKNALPPTLPPKHAGEHELDALQVAKPNPGPKDDGASKALMH